MAPVKVTEFSVGLVSTTTAVVVTLPDEVIAGRKCQSIRDADESVKVTGKLGGDAPKADGAGLLHGE